MDHGLHEILRIPLFYAQKLAHTTNPPPLDSQTLLETRNPPLSRQQRQVEAVDRLFPAGGRTMQMK